MRAAEEKRALGGVLRGDEGADGVALLPRGDPRGVEGVLLHRHGDQLLPICMEHVKQGLQHVLDQNLDTKKAILKYVFGHWEAKSLLRMDRANCLLRDLMGPNEGKKTIDTAAVNVVS